MQWTNFELYSKQIDRFVGILKRKFITLSSVWDWSENGREIAFSNQWSNPPFTTLRPYSRGLGIISIWYWITRRNQVVVNWGSIVPFSNITCICVCEWDEMIQHCRGRKCISVYHLSIPQHLIYTNQIVWILAMVTGRYCGVK